MSRSATAWPRRERVVTAANFLIDAESNLKAALQSMAVASTPGAAEEKRP